MEATRQRKIDEHGPRALVALVIAAAALLLLAVPARAQDDPYGSTSTTIGAEVEAACELSVGVGSTGSTATATVTGVPAGETVRLLLDGQEVGEATAGEGQGGSGTATVEIPFVVPDVDDGTYVVAAVGATFSVECGAGFTAGGPQVLGFTVERGSSGSVGSSGASRGSLPLTGLAVGLLLAVAVALLILGRTLVEPSRRLAASTPGTSARGKRE